MKSFNMLQNNETVPAVTGYTTNTYGTYTASSYTPASSPPAQENLKKSALKVGNKYSSKA